MTCAESPAAVTTTRRKRTCTQVSDVRKDLRIAETCLFNLANCDSSGACDDGRVYLETTLVYGQNALAPAFSPESRTIFTTCYSVCPDDTIQIKIALEHGYNAPVQDGPTEESHHKKNGNSDDIGRRPLTVKECSGLKHETSQHSSLRTSSHPNTRLSKRSSQNYFKSYGRNCSRFTHNRWNCISYFPPKGS
jgi:hypothetical protein